MAPAERSSAARGASPQPHDEPHDEPYGLDAPLYTVAAVARRLGLAPATLRTWDRRYGLGPSAHTFGAHRRFSDADVERLQKMRQLTLAGIPPAEAARLAMLTEAVATRSSPGGGRVLAMPGRSAAVRGLARAAMSLDAEAITATVRRSVRERGVPETWHSLVVPVLQAVGDRWAATGQGIEVEHLLAESALAALRASRAGQLPKIAGPARVLLACAADDYHALPLQALAAALADRGVASRNLGAAVPSEALGAAVRRVGPAVLFLWSSLRQTGDPARLLDVPVTAPAASILLGGPGWWEDQLPARVTFCRDIPHAVELVEQRLGL